LDHVRGEVVRDQHRALFRMVREHLPRIAQQHRQHALDHLHDVLLALPQVRVFDLLELLDQPVHLLHQRPFGVAQLLGDDLARGARQRFVAQQHRVDIDEGADFRGGVGLLDLAPEVVQFARHLADRRVEALDFGGHLLRLDVVVRDLERCVRNELRPPIAIPPDTPMPCSRKLTLTFLPSARRSCGERLDRLGLVGRRSRTTLLPLFAANSSRP
jgi:hypothetical protein